MMKSSGVFCLGVCLSILSSYAISNDYQLIEQGKYCASLTDSRLERLTCFDEAFDTRVLVQKDQQGQPVIEEQDLRPAFWHSVVAQEMTRTAEDVFVSNLPKTKNDEAVSEYREAAQENTVANSEGLTVGSTSSSRVVLTQVANGALPPKPILVMSCIDNITRLQILLHNPIDEGMTPVNLIIDGQAIASRWFSESNGYLIRAGRGLPGIEDIRSMFGKKSLVIRSKTSELDNLSFDISTLVTEIKPLSIACHW